MSSEELEPDAYYFEQYINMKTDSVTKYAPKHPEEWIDEVDISIVPESIKPLYSAETIKEARRIKEMHFTQVVLEAEQRGIVSAGQAQEINDLRDELEEVDQS